MSILPETADLPLRDGESIRHEWFGWHEQPYLLSSRAMKPGKIVLTNQRLAFQPQKMGLAIQALGVVGGTPVIDGDPWSTELCDVARVIDNGMSKQLTVEVRNLVVERLLGMDPETFLVTTSSDAMVDAIGAAVAAVDPNVGANSEKWSIAASSVQQGVAVGGRLSLVGRSLVFLPSGIEKAFDSLVGTIAQPILSMLGREVPTEAREIPLREIVAIEKVEGELSLANVRSGGLRDRLMLRTVGGVDEIFVVGDLDKTMTRLRSCLPAGENR